MPVASKKSGAVYERRLIESYISENGTEPTTGEELTIEDLIDLKTARTVKPRPPTLTSIPSLLGVFQEEWDALALQTFTLQQNLAQTRQELSTALYQHDAAVRVIARLTRERDEAREALSKISINGRAPATNGDAMQVDSAGLSPAVLARVDETQARLQKTRRKRPVPEDWPTADQIATYTPQPPSEELYPGGRFISVNATGNLALVGGFDGVAGVYSIPQRRIVQALKGGGGAITAATWAGNQAVIATSEGRIRTFESQQEMAVFEGHQGEVTGLALHPSGDILASCGADKGYALYDLATGTAITKIFTDSGKHSSRQVVIYANCAAALTCIHFHPDGHLLAAGGIDGNIRIYDVRSGSPAATFAANGPVQDLCFSENGTWLAVVVRGSTSISVWDLRKSNEIKAIDTGSAIESIAWDYTGQFLLAGGPSSLSVQQYSKAAKEWSEPLKMAISTMAIAWGANAFSILALGTDGAVTELTATS